MWNNIFPVDYQGLATENLGLSFGLKIAKFSHGKRTLPQDLLTKNGDKLKNLRGYAGHAQHRRFFG